MEKELMDAYQAWQEGRIKRRDDEIDVLWNGLRDVLMSTSLSDAKEAAKKALNATDPFLAQEVVQASEEVRVAS